MKYITIALAKGRLSEYAISLFGSIGADTSEMLQKSRKLIFTDENMKLKFVLVKASDVPTYVEYGAADIGIVGKDTILEEARSLYEMADLKVGNCDMCVCGLSREDYENKEHLRVATKYVNIAKDYFEKIKGRRIEIIKLNGSVELAPLVGLSDVNVDIVESGKTLEENGLSVIEKIAPLSARLVVNRVSIKVNKDRIMEIVNKLREKRAFV